MFDMSIAFKKIGKNQYLFFSGFAYVSKAYLITFKEKKALLGILNAWMRDIVAGTAILTFCSIRHKSHLSVYLALHFAFNCLRYFNVRWQIKKILGSRKKIQCEKQTFVSYHERIANTLTKKFIIQAFFGVIIIFPTGIFLFSQYKVTGLLEYLLGAIICICAGCVVVALLIFQCYLKLKNRDQCTNV